jgi:hypothetical protein
MLSHSGNRSHHTYIEHEVCRVVTVVSHDCRSCLAMFVVFVIDHVLLFFVVWCGVV